MSPSDDTNPAWNNQPWTADDDIPLDPEQPEVESDVQPQATNRSPESPIPSGLGWMRNIGERSTVHDTAPPQLTKRTPLRVVPPKK